MEQFTYGIILYIGIFNSSSIIRRLVLSLGAQEGGHTLPEIRILIIHNDNEVGTHFRSLLQKNNFAISVATNRVEANKLINRKSFNVAVIDLELPDTDGLSLLQQIKDLQPKCEVIVITGPKATRIAVKAMQMGAFDFLEVSSKAIEEVENLILKAVEYGQLCKVQPVNAEWSDIADRTGFLVGSSQAMHKLVSTAYKIAKKNVNVLIQGETGTGKEVLARFIYAASNRSDKVFIPVNCGALPANLLESELFGHEKGSFTGAANQRKGIFELSNEGTLFLDEVGESSLSIQVKLLRVLETGEFLRVGGEKRVKTDVRVISATNRDLDQSLKDKTFREDLFYRLDVVRLELPPLRERRNDIPLLVQYFVKQLNPNINISIDTMHLLYNYSWPGNIRELANTISQAVALCDDKTILPEHLSKKFHSPASKTHTLTQELSSTLVRGKSRSQSLEEFFEQCLAGNILESIELSKLSNLMQLLHRMESSLALTMRKKGVANMSLMSMESVEAEAIQGALDIYRGNVTKAAKALGIGRNTLYRKMKEYETKEVSGN
jgi:two-component system, NtrC family, response regulator